MFATADVSGSVGSGKLPHQELLQRIYLDVQQLLVLKPTGLRACAVNRLSGLRKPVAALLTATAGQLVAGANWGRLDQRNLGAANRELRLAVDPSRQRATQLAVTVWAWPRQFRAVRPPRVWCLLVQNRQSDRELEHRPARAFLGALHRDVPQR